MCCVSAGRECNATTGPTRSGGAGNACVLVSAGGKCKMGNWAEEMWDVSRGGALGEAGGVLHLFNSNVT